MSWGKAPEYSGEKHTDGKLATGIVLENVNGVKIIKIVQFSWKET